MICFRVVWVVLVLFLLYCDRLILSMLLDVLLWVG